jgi:hypothetical protein
MTIMNDEMATVWKEKLIMSTHLKFLNYNVCLNFSLILFGSIQARLLAYKF